MRCTSKRKAVIQLDTLENRAVVSSLSLGSQIAAIRASEPIGNHTSRDIQAHQHISYSLMASNAGYGLQIDTEGIGIWRTKAQGMPSRTEITSLPQKPSRIAIANLNSKNPSINNTILHNSDNFSSPYQGSVLSGLEQSSSQGNTNATSQAAVTGSAIGRLTSIRPMSLGPVDITLADGLVMTGGGFTTMGPGGPPPPPPPDVKVYLSGDGKHPNDPGNAPDVIEGSRWIGDPQLTGNDASDYEIVTTTWTFPEGAIKNYGAYDSSGNYTGPPAKQEPTDVKATTNFLSTDNSFYWGPTMVGLKTVKVEVTIRNKTTNAQLQREDKVELNILRPTGMIEKKSMGQAGVSQFFYDPSTGDPLGQFLGFEKNQTQYHRPPNEQPGYDWYTWIDPKITEGTLNGDYTVNGEFSVFQTGVAAKDIRTRYSGFQGYYLYETSHYNMPGVPRTEPALDAIDYPGPIEVGYAAPPLTGPNKAYDFDTPHIQLRFSNSSVIDPNNGGTYTTSPYDYYASDDFTQTLMYKPAGGIWIPVGMTTWGWSGVATYNSTTARFVETMAAKYFNPYQPTSVFPTWKHNLLAKEPYTIVTVTGPYN